MNNIRKYQNTSIYEQIK